jgi:hypothetical protein
MEPHIKFAASKKSAGKVAILKNTLLPFAAGVLLQRLVDKGLEVHVQLTSVPNWTLSIAKRLEKWDEVVTVNFSIDKHKQAVELTCVGVDEEHGFDLGGLTLEMAKLDRVKSLTESWGDSLAEAYEKWLAQPRSKRTGSRLVYELAY